MEFKKGDVVKLKSGGPRMTINDIGDYGYGGGDGFDQAKCTWFDEKNIIQEHLFTLEQLEKVVK